MRGDFCTIVSVDLLKKKTPLKGKFFLPLELRGFPHHPKYVDMELKSKYV